MRRNCYLQSQRPIFKKEIVANRHQLLLHPIILDSRHGHRFRNVERKWRDVDAAFVEVLDARRRAEAVVDDLPRVVHVRRNNFGHGGQIMDPQKCRTYLVALELLPAFAYLVRLQQGPKSLGELEPLTFDF